MYKLYLDDIRTPPDDSWVVARSYNQAVKIFEDIGAPAEVSFDHDLGVIEGTVIPDKTGYDFAHFLVEKDLDTGCLPKNFKYSIHSANPIGRENIEKLFSSYFKFTERFS